MKWVSQTYYIWRRINHLRTHNLIETKRINLQNHICHDLWRLRIIPLLEIIHRKIIYMWEANSMNNNKRIFSNYLSYSVFRCVLYDGRNFKLVLWRNDCFFEWYWKLQKTKIQRKTEWFFKFHFLEYQGLIFNYGCFKSR